jgi:hypothetical protein
MQSLSRLTGLSYRLVDFVLEHELGNMQRISSKPTDFVLLLRSVTVRAIYSLYSAIFYMQITCLEWLGSLGAILGFFFGMALVWSPLGILYFTLSRESETLTKT